MSLGARNRRQCDGAARSPNRRRNGHGPRPQRSLDAGRDRNLKAGEQQSGQQGKTDTSGKFRFDAVPPGNYSIEVQREGFKKSDHA